MPATQPSTYESPYEPFDRIPGTLDGQISIRCWADEVLGTQSATMDRVAEDKTFNSVKVKIAETFPFEIRLKPDCKRTLLQYLVDHIRIVNPTVKWPAGLVIGKDGQHLRAMAARFREEVGLPDSCKFMFWICKDENEIFVLMNKTMADEMNKKKGKLVLLDFIERWCHSLQTKHRQDKLATPQGKPQHKGSAPRTPQREEPTPQGKPQGKKPQRKGKGGGAGSALRP